MRGLSLLIISSVCIVFASFAEVIANDEPECFQLPSSECIELYKNGTKCTNKGDLANILIFCCNVTNEREITDYARSRIPDTRHVTGFHMRDSVLTQLGIQTFDELTPLTSFSITSSNISRIYGTFVDHHDNLRCLNISHNTIDEINPHLMQKLKGLTNIVMTNNSNVSILPDLPTTQVSFKLDLSGNYQLSCRYLINITLHIAQSKINLTHLNKNSTICLPPKSKLFNDKVVHMRMEQLDTVKEIYNHCPVINGSDNCNCSVYSLDIRDDGQAFAYQALVNCSRMHMTSLPKQLPPNTRVLDVSNNEITSFEGINNQTYSSILELYADNNKITSLDQLQGSKFLFNFQTLSLKNNKIEQIHLYLFTNLFDRTQHSRTVWLSKNELRCDCITASQTRVWLETNKVHIPDYNEIYASCDPRTRVIEMSHKELCSQPRDWKDYMRYIIYAELTLFVLLIGKVSYDYYIFKTFGYLPWPASKMPKLPCDWCFET